MGTSVSRRQETWRAKARGWMQARGSTIGYSSVSSLSPFKHQHMQAPSLIVRNRRWFHFFVLSAALLAAGCKRGQMPGEDIGADIEEVAATLIEQPLLHSSSIAVVYRGKESLRHHSDMEAGEPGPPTDAALYEISSLSKTMAGTLMATRQYQQMRALDRHLRHEVSPSALSQYPSKPRNAVLPVLPRVGH